MKILVIGGTGNISWWCVDEAVRSGAEVTILTRGETLRTRRAAQKGVRQVRGDVGDLPFLSNFVENEHFDVVSDFIAYSRTAFADRWRVLGPVTDKYVFVSSTLIYERSETVGTLTEESLKRPFGLNDYIDGKLGIEAFVSNDADRLRRSLVVRPAHTFDTNVPTPLGSNCFTDIQRLLDGLPLLIPGDGTGLWTIMHSADFARAWWRLVQKDESYGKSVNVVGDKVMSWNEIASIILDTLRLPAGQVKYVPIAEIEALSITDQQTSRSSNLSQNFSLHRKWNDLYDTAMLERLIPGWQCQTSFRDGFRGTIDWLLEDPARIRINLHLRHALNQLAGATHKADQQ